jgi:cardiolipin synthase
MSRNLATSKTKKKSAKISKKKSIKKIKRPQRTLLTNWATEQCFQDQEEIFTGLLDDFSSASNLIYMEMFIFQLDSLGIRVLKELKKAAKRGVTVRIIVDGLGSPMFTPDIISKLEKDGIIIKVYKPISQFLNRIKESLTNLEWHGVLTEILSMNSRNHRKICLIDSDIGWVGSANIGLNYADWGETMIRVSGPNVTKIKEGFDWMWNRVNEGFFQRKVKDLGNHLVFHSLNPLSKPENPPFRIQFINSALKKIRLVNPYFIPPYTLLLPLLNARQRGVDVEILTSKKSDYFFTRWFARSYYQVLLKHGVKIYERKSKFIHSKVLIVDNQAIVGTSNYNHRSVNSDLEIDILVDHIDTIKCLISKWNEDLQESDLILEVSDTVLWKKFIKLLNPLKKLS